MTAWRRSGRGDVGPEAERPVIVHVLNEFGVGGMENVALNVIDLTRERYAHRIVSMHGEGALAPRARALGIPVTALGKKPGKDIGAYIRLCRVLRASDASLVHTYNIGALDVAFWARAAGVRYIVHAEHGRDSADPQGLSPKYRWLRRALAPLIAKFIPVSADLERWLSDSVGIASSKIRLIRNGIDTDRFGGLTVAPSQQSKRPGETIQVVTVGRLDPVKGFDTLVEAFAALVESGAGRNVSLNIVGDGPLRSALAEQIERLGLNGCVKLSGNRDDVDQILAAADIYICSSIAEGIALTVLEAMASALAVVATDVGGNPELVEHERTGLLVNAGDVSGMAQALRRLIGDADERARFGENARCMVEMKFSRDRMVSDYCQLYDELLRRTVDS